VARDSALLSGPFAGHSLFIDIGAFDSNECGSCVVIAHAFISLFKLPVWIITVGRSGYLLAVTAVRLVEVTGLDYR
jgi:hypothetical protein